MSKPFKWFSVGFIIFATIILVAPYVITLDEYKPELESQLSEALDRNVLVSTFRAQLFPYPALTAKGIGIIGKKPGELFIKKLELIPDINQLLSGKLVIKRIKLDGLATNHAFLKNLIADLSNKKPSTSTVPKEIAIEQISATSMTLRTHNDIRLGPYKFSLFFDPDSRLKLLTIARMDDSLRINMTPDDKGYLVNITVNNWIVPIGPPFLISKLTANGIMQNKELNFINVRAQGYGGQLVGPVNVSWADGWNITSDAVAKAINIESFIAPMRGKYFKGEFDAEMKLTLSATKASKLLKNYSITGRFKVSNGMISKPSSKTPVFVFDEFSGIGSLKDSRFSTQDAILTAYGGKFTGNPMITWKQGWQSSGKLEAESVDVEKLLIGFVDQKTISGTFSGSATVSISAEKFVGLAKKPIINGQFDVKDGVFYKADLEKASKSLSKKDTPDGETPFDTLNGSAVIKNNNIWLSNLRIQSPSLEARGKIKIDQNKNLTGKMDVGLRKMTALTSIPMVIQGTTAEPQIRPTGAAMVGGVVGTSVLGPGIGTAIGIKVGKFFSAIGSVFSKDDDEK